MTTEDVEMEGEALAEDLQQVMVELTSETGETPFAPFSVSRDVTPEKLKILLQAFKEASSMDDDDEEDSDDRPYLFFINGHEVKTTINDCFKLQLINFEKTIQIVYQPQAVFRVRPVSRCTSSMPGHSQPVIVASFSPTGQYLASGSGDTTVRFWDLNTETPQYECKFHKQWILAIAWAPNGSKLASGDKAGIICLWDPKTGKQLGKTLAGHKNFITALAWEPLHLNGECRKLASSSKDGDVRIWDVLNWSCIRSLTGHTMSVTCLKWGGSGLIYSSSQDRTIKVWRPEDGALCRTLQGHGHWVNVLALNTDYVMRTGAFDPSKAKVVHEEICQVPEKNKNNALKRYQQVISTIQEELMVSGSDDFTMFLWNPGKEKKSIARLTGHQQLVNDVKFSPDGRYLVSASFDKSLRLWDGKSGKFLAVLRGHVQAVYQVAWSADSRLLVSGSADSTLKLWSMKTLKMSSDLPGHGDEVFTVDWSPDGQRVVSGGKDKVLRIWRR